MLWKPRLARLPEIEAERYTDKAERHTDKAERHTDKAERYTDKAERYTDAVISRPSSEYSLQFPTR